MRIVVVYESSYGNTHHVAEAIGDGMQGHDVRVVPVSQAGPEIADGADLLVVGGPTHVHGMSREQTRKAAIDAAHKPGSTLTLEPDAAAPGLREWFQTLPPVTARAAAFDTRVDMSALLSGRASKGISRQLQQHGCVEIVPPMSFLVTKDGHLVEGQLAAAREWGEQLVSGRFSPA